MEIQHSEKTIDAPIEAIQTDGTKLSQLYQQFEDFDASFSFEPRKRPTPSKRKEVLSERYVTEPIPSTSSKYEIYFS